MREKLDDDDDVYKDLVYISLASKRCFCVALFCVFVSRINFFFLSFSATKLICRV